MKKLKWIYLAVATITLAFTVSCQKEDQPGEELELKTTDIVQSTTDGLVAYYPFNGNANDESGNEFNGSVNGAVLTTDRFGLKNSSYSFDKGQDITVPNTDKQNLFPISISLWYNADSILKDERCNVFSKYAPAAWNGYQIKTADYRNVGNNDGNGNIYFNNGFGTNSWYIKDTQNRVLGFYSEAPFLQQNIFFNVWYHYVLVVDETGGKIYVDGKLIAAHSWTGTPGSCNNSYCWKIGGYYNSWFKGKIDDIRIYNRTLTEDEIVYLYNN